MTRRRRTVRDERGVSLMLVLVTLVIFGLIVPVLGQFGSTNGVSGYVLKGNRFDRYAAESAMQAAINWAQSQHQAG
jgi:Tfp pilus assembly protein PilX